MRPYRTFHVLLCILALSLPVCSAPASPADAESALTAKTFSRVPALPKWAQPLAEAPPTERTDSVVVRLMETQAYAGATPAMLFNRAIQVNERQALAIIGQVGLSYYPAYQKLLLHRVAILRGGQKLDRTNTVNTRFLQREERMEQGMYGGATTVQLLLDDVRVGDTLLISYTIEGSNPVFGKRWSESFSFDGGEPIELRRLIVLHPKERTIRWQQFGDFRTEAITPQIDEVGGMQRLRFEARGIEPLEFEQGIPSDYFAGRFIQFTEYQNWAEVADWAAALFPVAQPGPELTALIKQFQAEPTPAARAAAAMRWVQNEVRYFSVSIGENSHRPQDPNLVLKRRYGDCKDKTYLLVTLLRGMGMSARPLLVMATAPKLPGRLMATPTSFDHVITQLNLEGQEYYLDATRQGQVSPLDKLAQSLPGATGLPVAAGVQALQTLPARKRGSPQYERAEKARVTSFEGDVSFEVRETYSDNYAEWARLKFPALSSKEMRREMLSLYEKQYPGVTLVDAPVLTDDAAANQFVITARYTLPNPLVQKDKRYALEYDTAIVDGTLGVPDKVVRNFPLSLARGGFEGRYRLSIQWPDGVRLNEPVRSNRLDNAFFSASDEYAFRGQVLDYALDYRVKVEQAAAKEVPELQKQAKRLRELMRGDFSISKGAVLTPLANAVSFRSLDMIRTVRAIQAYTESIEGKADRNIDKLAFCKAMLPAAHPLDATESKGEGAASFESVLAGANTPDLHRCLGRRYFQLGRYRESLAEFMAAGAPELDAGELFAKSWASFYEGQFTDAVELAGRSRELNGGTANAWLAKDVANEMLLRQRTGEPVPEPLLGYARANPDGVWPRPLPAFLAGDLSQQALLAKLDTMGEDGRELAWTDAWFYIGQKALLAQQTRQAHEAFERVRSLGLRSEDSFRLAELALKDMDARDGQGKALAQAAALADRSAAAKAVAALAERGDRGAQNRLGEFYAAGDGLPIDDVLALQWYRQAAEQGDPAAQNNLALRYLKGRGVPRDHAMAAQWLRKAAEGGNLDAMVSLGSLLLGDKAVTADIPVALGWYQQAADRGRGDAAFLLAEQYRQGKVVAQNLPLAVRLYRSAVTLGNNDGIAQLGEMYLHGNMVSKDPEVAMYFLSLGDERHHGRATYLLAEAYEQGLGVAQDKTKAQEVLTRSAEAGYAEAQLALGLRYYRGKGVRKDTALGTHWLRLAAKQGVPYAQYTVAADDLFDAHFTGDRKKALQWLEQAAAAGVTEAYVQQALAYREGKLGRPNMGKALELLHIAIDKGDREALNELGDMYENGNGVSQDYARAIQLYKQSADKGYYLAYVSLGSLYEHGKGLPRDLVRAYACYDIAEQLEQGTGLQRRNGIATQLTQLQLEQARKLASGWKPDAPPPAALLAG